MIDWLMNSCLVRILSLCVGVAAGSTNSKAALGLCYCFYVREEAMRSGMCRGEGRGGKEGGEGGRDGGREGGETYFFSSSGGGGNIKSEVMGKRVQLVVEFCREGGEKEEEIRVLVMLQYLHNICEISI